MQPQLKVDARQYQLPMYETVMEKIGKPIVFNICMLGAVVGLTDLVRPESIMKVLEARIPSGFLENEPESPGSGAGIGGARRLDGPVDIRYPSWAIL